MLHTATYYERTTARTSEQNRTRSADRSATIFGDDGGRRCGHHLRARNVCDAITRALSRTSNTIK